MGESRDKVIKAIKHYQDSLERHSKTKKSDKLLHAIERLSSLPIRVWHLEETGVGRTVNGLKRYEGEVGESARNLVDKWKCMVKDEEEEELAKQEKQQEIDETEEPDEEALQIAEPPEEVNGNRDSDSVKVKKRRRSEEKHEKEHSSKKSKSSHHHSKHKQRKKSESEDSDNSQSSDTKSKAKRRHSSEDSSSDSSSSDDSDNSESSQSDSKHRKRKESSKHSKDTKREHHSKDKSSSNSKKLEPDRKHKESSSSRNKDKSDKENVSSKERSSSSKSSTSSKHKHSNSDKEKSDKTRKSSSKSDSKEKPAEKISKPKIRDTEQLVNGIDSGSGASFADALGMLEAPVPLKSKKKKLVSNDVKASSSKSLTPKKESVEPKKSSEVPSLLKSPEELEPLSINDLSSLLPSITPNYRPLGLPVEHHRKGWTDEEALSRVISAKHQRTKVYSGNKSMYTKVPTLFDICSRVLQDNLDALEYTGGVPYTILKHILEKANPNQLYQLEFHNPYLIEETDELWQLHCQKEFRNQRREEMETWRDMYMRCLDERDARLKALTANIKQSQDKSIPVRQTKLAYVDSVVKPPRNIARKQAKNGIMDFKKPSQTPSERLSQLAKAGEASKVSVPNPGRAAADRSGSSSSHSSSNLKPKKAPLMAKTLSLLKNRFGRR